MNKNKWKLWFKIIAIEEHWLWLALLFLGIIIKQLIDIDNIIFMYKEKDTDQFFLTAFLAIPIISFIVILLGVLIPTYLKVKNFIKD
jgi:hypothetical protein